MPRPPRRHATRRRGNGRNGAEDYPGAKRVGVSHEALTAGDPCPSGNGLPFNRLAGLQENLGMPLPSSTQLDIVAEASSLIQPAYDELIRQAAQGHVLHNDDTTVTILELMGERAKPAAASAQDASSQPDRTGLFTTGVVATSEGRRIALFFSGRKHAGENLWDVLLRRATDLPPLI